MSDVFVSYARPDEGLAKRVADALRALGYAVWRDDELPVHRAYADVIAERLKSANAVVVLWSADAVKSQWVRAEADAARAAGTLVQASLDGSLPPMPFNQIQCADLKDWNDDPHASAWRKLETSVAALAGTHPLAEPARERRQQVSVCVLPFANMSGDAEQEYFSDGISEDITTDLSKVSALEVIARNTAFQFKGRCVDITAVAKKLGVSHVLEGSVRKAANRVRITAQLIDGHSGGHVWAERYDRDLTDIFAIQDEISKAIVEALKVKLLPEEEQAIENRGTTSAEAYNLYLMARKHWVSGSHGDPRREETVERICRQAVALDPEYARAWALMALAQANLRMGFGRSGDGGLPAAERALELDPTIAEAHCVRAQSLSHDGETSEANAEIDLALSIDPESWEANKEAGRLAMMQRRIPEATEYFEKATSLMDTDFHSWSMLITCYRVQGDAEQVGYASKMLVERAAKAVAEDPTNAAALGEQAVGLAILGQPEQAKQSIAQALLLEPNNNNLRYNFACTLANELQDPEAALDLLEPALATCGKWMCSVAATDPDLDKLRGNPRFQKMFANARRRHGVGSADSAANPSAAA
jgi:adenylate cyclase